MSATIEQLGKLSADLRDAIEKGTEPSKSLKRKHERRVTASKRRTSKGARAHQEVSDHPSNHSATIVPHDRRAEEDVYGFSFHQA